VPSIATPAARFVDGPTDGAARCLKGGRLLFAGNTGCSDLTGLAARRHASGCTEGPCGWAVTPIRLGEEAMPTNELI
jgi:hypothetical protein